jgi:transcriptional regulator with XRE-family HTH domain
LRLRVSHHGLKCNVRTERAGRLRHALEMRQRAVETFLIARQWLASPVVVEEFSFAAHVDTCSIVIREARRAKGWSLRDLDRAAGVASNYLWSLEKPGKGVRRPGAEVLGKIADALDLSLDVLFLKVGWRKKRPIDPPIDVPPLDDIFAMVVERKELRRLVAMADLLFPRSRSSRSSTRDRPR